MALGTWGALRPPDRPEAYDFERLERAVEALLERQGQLRAENDQLQSDNQALRAQIAARTQQGLRLEHELRASTQERVDLAKRLEELIEQLRQLEAHLGAQP